MATRRTTRAKPKKSLKTKLKQDPVGTAKAEVKKTGALQIPIGAYILGIMGGTGMAVALSKIPIVGGVMQVMANKGAKLASSMKK